MSTATDRHEWDLAYQELRRAKKDVGVISQQIDRAWVWQLPDQPSDGQAASE